MGFSNTTTAGDGTLIVPAIKSPNYKPLTSGWSINRDGTVDITGLVIGNSISNLTDGTLNANGTIGTGSLRTGTVGARVVLDSTGLTLFDGGGTQTVKLDSATGNAAFSGTITASTVTGSTITGGLFRTAASGQRVEISGSSAGQVQFYDAFGNNGYIQAQNTYGSNEIALHSGGGTGIVTCNDTYAQLRVNSGTISTDGTNAAMVSPGSGSFQIGSGVAGALLNVSGAMALQATGSADLSSSASTASLSAPGLVTVTSSTLVQLSATEVTGNLTVDNDTHTTGQIYAPGTYAFTSAGAGATINLETGANHRFYRFTSSRLYKRDIKPLEDGLPVAVLQLQPRTYVDRAQYEANGDSAEGLTRHLGVIAEDVDQIPELAELLVQHEDDGTCVGVNYAQIALLLIPLVRDLSARVRSLEERLGAS